MIGVDHIGCANGDDALGTDALAVSALDAGIGLDCQVFIAFLCALCLLPQVIEAGKYGYQGEVEILMTASDHKFYRVGEGVLRHSTDGFVLDGCNGKLHYEHKPLCSHTVNADFYFYQIGDVISFGNNDYLYYCFPKGEGDVVTKMRLAAEEIYKIKMQQKADAKLTKA